MTDDSNTLPCPNCIKPMSQEKLSHIYGQQVTIDSCYPCHLFWFDKKENFGLAATSVIQLLELIHEHGHRVNHSVKPDRCPRCDFSLKKVQDQQRNTVFFHYECICCKGHAISFFEFMKEKNFVRALDGSERARLAAAAQQIHCSSCGAPADLAREERCQFCEAPFSYLDPDQLHHALQAIRKDLKVEDVAQSLESSYREARAARTLSDGRLIPEPEHAPPPLSADLFDLALGAVAELARW